MRHSVIDLLVESRQTFLAFEALATCFQFNSRNLQSHRLIKSGHLLLFRECVNRLLLSADGPKISCFSTRTSLWEKNAYLRCEIRSNPRFSALYWIIDNNGTTLAEGEFIDGLWILVAVRRIAAESLS